MSRRIIVISEDFVEPWDEGIKKFAYSVGTAFKREHDVLMLNVDRSGVGDGEVTRWLPSSKTFLSADLRREVRAFGPDVVLYVPSPSATLASFMRCFVLRRHYPRALLGMVALMPRRHPTLARPMLEGAQPDVTFVPSYQSLLYYRDRSVHSELLPIGVDLATFSPPQDPRAEKLALRRRHGVALNSQVYLHVGHLSPRRNLDALATLAAIPGVEVIVVGSTSTAEDRAVRNALESAGVRVIREIVPVHEFYRLADCYVFPTRDSGGCVEIPLSVFEALASGLPVVARPFGGLRDFLPPGDDLRYWETEDELAAAAAALRRNGRPQVRDMHAFSWDQVVGRILETLDRVVG
jgi:glycosyltransferase involved in cell wall biosynthesis